MYNVYMRSSTENKFGENLRRIRRKKGYTQAQLARLSGISRRMIGHYETQVKRPSIEKVKKISETLGVSDEELLGIVKSTKSKKKDDDISYKIMKRVRMIEKLPKRDQDVIFSLINTRIARYFLFLPQVLRNRLQPMWFVHCASFLHNFRVLNVQATF